MLNEFSLLTDVPYLTIYAHPSDAPHFLQRLEFFDINALQLGHRGLSLVSAYKPNAPKIMASAGTQDII